MRSSQRDTISHSHEITVRPTHYVVDQNVVAHLHDARVKCVRPHLIKQKTQKAKMKLESAVVASTNAFDAVQGAERGKWEG